MTESKALLAAEQQIAALEARVAQLEARVAQLAQREAHSAKTSRTAPVVSHYTDRFGRVWEKVRTGNTATSRLVEEYAS